MKAYVPREIIEEIKSRINIIDVVSSALPLKKQGRNFVGLCPFHLEDTPSFTVSPDKQIFYCFGCQKGGTVIDFVMEYEHITFPEAIEKLAQRAGVDLPEKEMSVYEKKVLDDKRLIFDINKAAVDYFILQLNSSNNKMVNDYIIKRGLSKEIVEKFSLGYASDEWEGLKRHLLKIGYKENELLKAGVVVKGDSGKVFDRFRNRLMFPIADAKSHYIAFGGRVLDDSLPKYLNSAETMVFNKSRNLYGLNVAMYSIREKDEAVLMEGYMDVIMAHQYGIDNAIASLGTAFTEEQAKTIKRYTSHVVIAYDGDKAGQKATLRGMEILSRVGFRVRIIDFPDNKDPDDYLKAYGKEGFDKLIDSSLTYMEYKIKKVFAMYDSSKPEGKADIVRDLLDSLLSINDIVERNDYIQKLADKLDISRDILFVDIENAKAKGKSVVGEFITKVQDNTCTATMEAKRRLCQYIVGDKSIYDKVVSELADDVFRNDIIGDIMELIRDNYEDFQFNYGHLLDIAKEPLRSKLLTFSMKDIADGDICVVVDDCIKTIKKEQHSNKLLMLENLVRNAKNDGKYEEIARLLQEIVKIQQELRKL